MSKPLINRSSVKDFTFKVLAEKRAGCAGKMTRISGEFFEKVDAQARTFVAEAMANTPAGESESLVNLTRIKQFVTDKGGDQSLLKTSSALADAVNSKIRTWITGYVESMPSVGKTIK